MLRFTPNIALVLFLFMQANQLHAKDYPPITCRAAYNEWLWDKNGEMNATDLETSEFPVSFVAGKINFGEIIFKNKTYRALTGCMLRNGAAEPGVRLKIINVDGSPAVSEVDTLFKNGWASHRTARAEPSTDPAVVERDLNWSLDCKWPDEITQIAKAVCQFKVASSEELLL